MVVRLRPWPLYLRPKSLRYSLKGSLGGPWSWSGRFEEKKISLHLPEFELRIVQPVAVSLYHVCDRLCMSHWLDSNTNTIFINWALGKLSRRLIKHHAMKSCWGNGVMAPCTLYLQEYLEVVANFMPWQLYILARAPSTHPWWAPQYGRFGKKNSKTLNWKKLGSRFFYNVIPSSLLKYLPHIIMKDLKIFK